jgi:K(+)-stimulated pyrophosphate-energized sodium pump
LIGFLIGAVLSGACRLHRHERLGARQRAHRAGRDQSLAGGLDSPSRRRAITGMLVAGLALLGVTLYFAILTGSSGIYFGSRHGLEGQRRTVSTRWSRSASAPR